MTGIGRLGADILGQLQRFKDSAEVDMLVKLTRAECLLALARLSGMHLDTAQHAEKVVELITQFVPVRGAAIHLDLDDRVISKSIGDRCGEESYVRELSVEGSIVGHVSFLPMASSLTPGDFADSIASEISEGLVAVIAAERLRRDAAVARSVRCAQDLANNSCDQTVAEFTEAVMSLPNIAGATVAVHADDEYRAYSQGKPPEQDSATGDTRPVALAVCWKTPPCSSDRRAVEKVVTELEGALARAGTFRRLLDEAEKDPLTGIGNRRHATRALTQALARACESGDPVAVLYMDLDHFKQVNDRFGHDTGDRVLAAFASHLKRATRQDDIAARYGGEEFLLVCPGMDAVAGQSTAERIRAGTPAACATVLNGWQQTVSVGVSVFACSAGESGTSGPLDEILDAADKALYLAKNSGRDRVEVAFGGQAVRKRGFLSRIR